MTRPREWRFLIGGLVAADTLALAGAFAAAYVARFQFGWFAVHDITPNERNYLAYGGAGIILWLTAFLVSGLYQPDLLLAGTREMTRLLQACLAAFAGTVVLSSLSGSVPFISRGVLVAALLFSILLTGGARLAIRRIAYRLRQRRLFITRAVVIGANDDGVSLARQLDRPGSSGVDVVGFLDDYLPTGTLVAERWPVLGPPNALPGTAVDEALVVPSALSWESHFELMQRIARGTAGPTIRIAPGFFDLFATGLNVVDRGNVPVVTARRSRITGVDALAKRTLETTLAALLLVTHLPWAMVWAFDRWSRGRPVLIRRTFHGANGSMFTAITFTPSQRRHSAHHRMIEKLPLLLSVLSGRLALIGPRLTETSGNEALVHRLALLAVRPGLTGPVSVHVPNGPDEQALALELRYVRDYSIWLDLQLIWRRGACLVHDLLHPEQARTSQRARPLPPPDTTVSRPSPVEAP